MQCARRASLTLIMFGCCCFAVRAEEVTAPEEPQPFLSIGDSASDSHHESFAAYETESCDCSCDEECCTCAPRWWMRGQYLLWWTEGQNLPTLVTTSPNGTPRAEAGVLGFPNTTTLFGAQRVADDERHGVRWSLGTWLDDTQCSALEGEWFSVGDANSTGNFFASSNGDPILARPFFNVSLGAEDSALIAFPNLVAGQIAASSSSELHSGNLLLRSNLRRGYRGRLDLLTGYRYFRFREDLLITENLVSTDPGGFVQVGTTLDLFDRFVTENDFHGGELGLAIEMDHGPWTFGLLGKVALGNVHQQLEIDGGTVVATPGGSTTARTGGLLALPTNIGSYSHNEFGVLPELTTNIDYRINDCWSLTIGYTFIYLSDLLRTGDQIDRFVNPTQLTDFDQPGGGGLIGDPRPRASLSDTDFWAQGLNVGLKWVH